METGTLGSDGEADGRNRNLGVTGLLRKQGLGTGAADSQVDFTQGTIEGDGGGGRQDSGDGKGWQKILGVMGDLQILRS